MKGLELASSFSVYRIVAIKTPPKAEEDTYNNIYVRIQDIKIAKASSTDLCNRRNRPPLMGLAPIRRSDHARNMRPLLGCLLGNNVSWEVRHYHFDNGSNASSPKKHTSSDAEAALILKLRLS